VLSFGLDLRIVDFYSRPRGCGSSSRVFVELFGDLAKLFRESGPKISRKVSVNTVH